MKNMCLKKIVLVLGLFVLWVNSSLVAQVDTLFWFAVPNVCNNHSGGDDTQELRLASFNTTDVTVTIDIPSNPSFTPRVRTLTPGGLITEIFNKNDVEIPTNNNPSNNGLRIRASNNITAYYEIGRETNNTDIFSLKGTNALGTRFYTVFQNEYDTDDRFYPEAQSSVNIVAIDNNTQVTITLPAGKTAAGWGSDVTRTITLQKGQTYSFASSSALGSNRLTGTLITSTKKIAVTTSDDSIRMGGAGDLAGDQTVPVNVSGTEYLIPPGQLSGSDGDNTAYIVATENNTEVKVNNSFIVTLSAGQSYAYKMADPPNTDSKFLSSTHPVYVLYLSGLGNEVGSPLLPTIKCTGSNKVAFVRSTNSSFYLTILAQNDAIGNFTIEGGGANQTALNDPSNYFDNPSFPGWKVLQREFSSIPTNTSITVQNSKAYFHLGIFNGDGSTATFGYFSDYGLIKSALPPRLSTCPNTTLVLDPKLFGTFNSKIWKRNGNVFSGGTIDNATGKLTFIVPPPQTAGIPDQYTLELKDNRACQFEDTVRLTVFAQPEIALNTEGNRNVCSNNPNDFILANQVKGTITNYLWKYFANAAAPATNPGNPFPSTPAVQHLPKVGGIYRVIGTDNNNCKDSAQVNITYNTAKLVNITDQIPLVCNNIGFTLKIINNPAYNGFKDFVWRKDNAILNGETNATYSPSSNGNYSLTVKDEFDCISSDNNNIVFVSPVSFDLGDKPTICSAENFNINVTLQPANANINSLIWFKDNVQFLSGVGNKTFKPTTAGVYRVDIVDNNNCPFNDAINISKFSTTVSVVLNTPASPFCSNSNDVLSHATPAVTPNFKRYQWQREGVDIPGADKSTYQPTQPGTYKLKVTDNNDCPSEDAKTINWQVAQTFDLGSDQNVVCTNGNFNITVNGSFSSLIWKFNTAIFTPTSGNGGKTHKPLLGQNGTYEVSGKDVNGCNASDAVAIGKVVDSTKLSLTQPPNNVCSNAGFKIDVSPNNLPKYDWFFNTGSAPAPNTSASYTPRASGTYRVIATDANTCKTSEKVTVNFVDTLALNLNAPPNVFCANNTTYIITPSGGSFSSYIFKRNNQIINPITGPGNAHKPSQTGIYLVEGTDSKGCISRKSVSINYQDTANFNLPQLPTVICDNANGNNTTTIIDATGSFANYQWFLNNVSFTPNVSPSKHRPTARGKYKVIVTDANTCTATDTVTANYFVPLTMKLTPSPAGNIACWNTNYTLTPTAGFTTYNWNVSATSPALTIPINTFAYKPLQSGKYKVIGTDSKTCKSADSITITYVKDFKLDLGGVKAVCTTVSAFDIDATKANIVRYDWSNSAGAVNPSITQPIFSVTGPGKYAVKLTDVNGCMDQDTLDFQKVTDLPLELGNKPFACSYENYEVDATANYKTYVWTNTAGLTNPNTSTSKFKVTKSGNYKVTVTDASGTCTATDDITISYVEDLGFQLNNNFADTICFNDMYPSRYILAKDSLKFTNIPYTWSWDVPNGEPKPGNIVKHQPGTSGRYIVKVTDNSNQCYDSDTVNVDFSRLLANFDLGKPNDTVCYNVRDSITSTLIEYRNTTQYTWAWKVENGATDPGTKTVAYPNKTGKYLATLTDRFKCKASDSVNVQFSDSLLDFDLGDPSLKICIATVGDQKVIEATIRKYDNTTNYKWAWTVPTDQVKPGNVSKVTPIKSGNYSVLITDKWGCEKSDSKDIEYFNDLFGFKIKTPKDTICFNDPLVDLTAKATDRKFDNLALYKWTWTVPANSKIAKRDSNAVVTDTSGKYVAIIINKENLCSNKDSIKIVFSDSLKNLVFTDPFDTICFNSDIARKTIEAIDKKYNDLKYYTWSWTLPDNSKIENVSSIQPKQSGVYIAKVKDVYGCEASANANIKYSKDLFGFDLGPAVDTICFNAKKTLTDTAFAKPQFTWQWTVKPRTNIKVLNDNKIQPDSSGRYIALIKNSFECFNSDSVDVIFSDSLLAFALAKPSDTICFNADSLKKMITTKVLKYKNLNEYTWSWDVPSGNRNPNNNFYAIPTKSGPFTATVQDRWKCKASSVTAVNFSNDLFEFDLGKPSDTVCFNLPKTITSTLDTFKTNYYTWEWIKVPVNAIPPNGAKSYQPKVSGTYTVKITNREKCDNKDSVDITFSDALAGFSLGNKEDTVCSNRPADSLQATSAIYNDLNKFNWKWTVPDNQINVGNYYKIFPRFSGNYTAIVTDQWKCEAQKMKTVTYGSPVVIGLNNDDTTACSYANYVINAGSGYVKYVWFNIPNYNEPTYRPTTTGKYKVTVTDRLGCIGSDSVNVKYVADINAQLPPTKPICDSDSLLEGGIITAASGFDTYKWMDNPVGGKNDTTYRPVFPKFEGNSIEQRITVVVTLDICSATAYTDITFIKKDNKYLGPDTVVCLNKPVLLDAGANFYSYVWKSTNTGDSVLSTAQSITVTRPDFYYVDLVSQCGSLRPSRDITNFDIIKYNFTPNTILCVGEKMDILNVTENKEKPKYHYTWYEKNTLTFISDTTYSINIEKPGNYQVIVRDLNKCIMLDSIQITMTEDCFTIPNLFTPNNDGKNDVFEIRGIYKGEWELEVYNRWGDRIYFNTKYDNSWSGDNVTTGVYYYELRNGAKAKKYKGWVQIAK